MRLKISRIQNGPMITDNLANEVLGFDLSAYGLDGGSPGDTTFFDLYIQVEPTDEEKELFDYIDNIGIYLTTAPNYSGDYSANLDLADILELGDLGFGLSILNPSTGSYDIVFNSSNYNSPTNLFVPKKEMAIWQDRSDLTKITNITVEGFDSATLASGTSLYTLKTSTNVFNERMVGLRVFNSTLGTSAVISEFVAPNEVIMETLHGFASGNQIFIKRLLEPHDGVLAIKDENGIILGNCFKLSCKFALPNSYQRTRIKQFNLEVISGTEGEE